MIAFSTLFYPLGMWNSNSKVSLRIEILATGKVGMVSKYDFETGLIFERRPFKLCRRRVKLSDKGHQLLSKRWASTALVSYFGRQQLFSI